MNTYFSGMLLGLILFACYMLFSGALGLWVAFILALVISTIYFMVFIKKQELRKKEVLLISLIGGSTNAIVSVIGIMVFPVETIRDIGDVIMPYIFALMFSACSIVVYLFVGTLLAKK